MSLIEQRGNVGGRRAFIKVRDIMMAIPDLQLRLTIIGGRFMTTKGQITPFISLSL